jgi:hypothetical protein
MTSFGRSPRAEGTTFPPPSLPFSVFPPAARRTPDTLPRITDHEDTLSGLRRVSPSLSAPAARHFRPIYNQWGRRPRACLDFSSAPAVALFTPLVIFSSGILPMERGPPFAFVIGVNSLAFAIRVDHWSDTGFTYDPRTQDTQPLHYARESLVSIFPMANTYARVPSTFYRVCRINQRNSRICFQTRNFGV